MLGLAAVTGCGGRQETGDGGCAAVVAVGDVVYRGVSLAGPKPPLTGPVDDGVIPACNDGGPPYDEADDVAVQAIRGVPPAVAVALEYEGDSAYLAPGFVTALASHPLHEAVFGVRRWTEKGLRRRCQRPARTRGVIQVDPHDTIGSRMPVGSRLVVIDGRTRYDGPRRENVPYLQTGDRLEVRGHACAGRRLVADAIASMP